MNFVNLETISAGRGKHARKFTVEGLKRIHRQDVKLMKQIGLVQEYE